METRMSKTQGRYRRRTNAAPLVGLVRTRICLGARHFAQDARISINQSRKPAEARTAQPRRRVVPRMHGSAQPRGRSVGTTYPCAAGCDGPLARDRACSAGRSLCVALTVARAVVVVAAAAAAVAAAVLVAAVRTRCGSRSEARVTAWRLSPCHAWNHRRRTRCGSRCARAHRRRWRQQCRMLT